MLCPILFLSGSFLSWYYFYKIKSNPQQEILHTLHHVLQQFELQRVLLVQTEAKKIFLLGKVNQEYCILVVEKENVDIETISQWIIQFDVHTLLLQNGIYNFCRASNTQLNDWKVGITYPILENDLEFHLKKLTPTSFRMVEETYKMYLETIVPIIKAQESKNEWIENILQHKKEQEHVILDYHPEQVETGFQLSVNTFMWDGKNVQNLQCLAIVYDRTLKSLRDLRGDKHVQLLKSILEEGTKAIENKYGLPRQQQRVYIHYQPSFYHLHVHFTNLNAPLLNGKEVERAHLIQQVIQNLELKYDYYQTVTLCYKK